MVERKKTKRKGKNISPRGWTEQEVRLFEQSYPNTHNKDLAKRFGRTIYSIRKKATKLGLKKDWEGGYRLPHSNPPNAWTKDEIETLKRMYYTSLNEEIAQKLGRTLAAVGTKIRDIGLSLTPKANRWTAEQIEYMKKHYAFESAGEIGRELGRSENAVRGMACKLKLSEVCTVRNGRKYSVWTEEEDSILRKYIFILPAEKIAKKLNRRVCGVKARAWKLSLLKQHRWTEQETRKLAYLLPKHTRKEIAGELGRTLESVITKLKRLGLKKQKPWKPRDIMILRKFFPIETNVKVAERLNRSASTISLKAREFGLHKSINYYKDKS